MSDDYKDIPTLDEVIKPGKLDIPKQPVTKEKTAEEAQQQAFNELFKAPPANNPPIENRQGDRRRGDRRVSKQALRDDQIERRIDERRAKQRREQDKAFSLALDQMVSRIIEDMMPDLEQHIRLQLRFEIEKHLPGVIRQNPSK